MTLRIEKSCQGPCAVIRLIGRIQSEYLEELAFQIKNSGPKVVLDLDEVTLVDVDVVRFLRGSEREGIELLHCPLFVREWMMREKEREG